MSFGSRLTQARKDKGFTQTDLGKGLGTDGKDVTKAVVYGWEKDLHFPRVDQLALICDRLAVGADWLVFGRTASTSLSPDVAELATAADRLQNKKARTWVLSTLRQSLITVEGLPPSPMDSPKQEGGQDEKFHASSERRGSVS